MSKDVAELVFKQWKASLKDKDRSRKYVSENFSELFNDMLMYGIKFEVAHEFLSKAILAHYPKPDVVRSVYKNLKPHLNKSEKEFLDDWKESIEDAATSSFHIAYPIEEEIVQIPESQKKNYGSMSREEYTKQRRYADSHPTVNPDEINFEPIEIEDSIYEQIADAGIEVKLEDL